MHAHSLLRLDHDRGRGSSSLEASTNAGCSRTPARGPPVGSRKTRLGKNPTSSMAFAGDPHTKLGKDPTQDETLKGALPGESSPREYP